MTYKTAVDHAAETSPFRRFVFGMIRRYKITRATGTRWQVRGQSSGSGGDELHEIEPFHGIGFMARPPASGSNPEAVGVSIAGAKLQLIVGTRDEAVRKLIDDQVENDGAAMFNTTVIILVKPDSTVEIRLHGGAAQKLLTIADGQALKDAITNAVPAAGAADGGAGLQTSIVAGLVHWPTGTSVLKAQ
jgi:hypothetical protein